MIQTRQILEQYKGKYPDFEYYYTIVQEVEDNTILHPDICVESCKALIEGVSRSVLDRLDNTRSREDINKIEFNPVYQEAIKKLDDEYHRINVEESNFEIDICNQFAKLVYKVNIIRNDRGDISHGRAVPKELNSNQKLARTVMGIADHIVAYILEHLFILLDALPKDSLQPYDCNDYEEFNKFLDSGYENFPISKAQYSQVLYDYEPETYFVKYKDFTSTTDEDTTIATEDYDSFSFWTDSRINTLNEFCQGWKFNPSKVLELIDRYWGRIDSISLDELIDLMYIQADREENERIALSIKSDLQLLIKQVLEIKK